MKVIQELRKQQGTTAKRTSQTIVNEIRMAPPRKKPKGKCFHCGIDGHWKRNCKKYLEELKQKKKGKLDLLVTESCLVENDLSPWIIDSGATNHICCFLQKLDSYTRLADGDFTLRVRIDALVSASTVGQIKLYVENNKFLFLNNVYFVPGFTRNLISVSRLYEQCYSVSFDNKSVVISRNGLNICSGFIENELYVIRHNFNSLLNVEMFKVALPKTKKQKVSHTDNTYLWHLRLGHINLDRINRLVKMVL